MNTAVFALRCLQNNIPMHDLDWLSMGMVFDILIESANDNEEYDIIAEQEDFDRF